MRQPVAVVVGAAVAAVAGVIAGEYPFTGVVPLIAGILIGLAVSETIVAIARRQSVALGAVSACLAAAGTAYAVWDDAGFGVRPVAFSAWVAVAVAFVTAGARGGWWTHARPARSTAADD